MTADTIKPPPLAVEDLRRVPGVLGRIALERLEDYLRVEGEERPVAPAPATSDAEPSLAASLRSPGLAIIAEIKRSSPSQGPIAPLDPAAAARAYHAGGAAALSVLTEPRHFQGDLSHLAQARSACALPVLRKDFTVHSFQIEEARAAGASAVLLIVALTAEHTGAYLRYARSVGLEALVEVHDSAELDVALAAGADIIGVNNRDLRTLEIDLATAPLLLAQARRAGYDGLLVAESGYRSREELRSVEGLADGVLVGTSLAGSGDLTASLRRLTGHGGRGSDERVAE